MANSYPAWAPAGSPATEGGNVTVNYGATFDWPISANDTYYVLLANAQAARGLFWCKVDKNNLFFEWRSPSPDPTGADPIAGTVRYCQRQINANALGGDNDNSKGTVYFDPNVPGGCELWIKWSGTGARSGLVVRKL